MKILAFAASSSRKSINKQLVSYTTGLIEKQALNIDIEIDIIDLNDYELPLFSEDREAELGQPQLAKDFLKKIGESDAVIISFAEHNGSYTAAYKNIFDWASRINPKVFQDKPMLFLATTPGAGGATSVLSTATTSAPYFDGDVIASFSLPSFYENFDHINGHIINTVFDEQLKAAINTLSEATVKPTNSTENTVSPELAAAQ